MHLNTFVRPALPPPPRPVLGSRVHATPCLGDAESRPIWGTITYINDAHRWYMVQFDAGYRQCYQFGRTA